MAQNATRRKIASFLSRESNCLIDKVKGCVQTSLSQYSICTKEEELDDTDQPILIENFVAFIGETN